ncbi:MAG: hypothetical protein AMXMBFR84_33010 [Candidatus Hydrogenedentota bacterium]
MSPDEFQQAWKSHTAQTHVTIDANLLREAVQRNQRELRTVVLWGDVGAIVIELILVLVFIVGGFILGSPWTIYLMAPALLWSIAFKLFHRTRIKRLPRVTDDSITGGIKASVALLDHQIWMERRIFRWTQLPCAAAMFVFFSHVTWLSSKNWFEAAVSGTLFAGIVLGVYGFTYYTTRNNIRTRHEPRRRELLALLASLGGADSREVLGEYPILLNSPVLQIPSPRKQIFGAVVAAAVIFLIGIGAYFAIKWFENEYPKIAPFSAVRWQKPRPDILVGEEWFTLAGVNTLPIEDIVAYGQKTYGDEWRKQFETNLGDVLTGMGHTPGETLRLVLLPFGSLVPQVVDHAVKTPFATVRWQDLHPEVRVEKEWYMLLSLNDIPASDIVIFCQENYEAKWRKRFEEDLVEVLTRMGHKPGNTVRLVVLPRGSATPRTLDNVPMTRENREKLRDANQMRERLDEWKTTENTVPVEGAQTLVAEKIPRLRDEKNLVGLAAMVMIDGRVIASAADGQRKARSGVPIEITDQWHLGSITKSITATMIARLIESGKMQWTDTIGTYFPEASVNEEWKSATLRHLLTHTSGAPANFPRGTQLQNPAPGAERVDARRETVLKLLAHKPDHTPGTHHAYSNAGYTIAGAMAEAAAGQPWEDLVTREVFEPLNLTSAGFGPPKSKDKPIEQPQGHNGIMGLKIGVGEDADNTPIIGPAGTAHMSLQDLCTYATEHMRGELGEGTILNADSYQRLHTPELDDYACGWVKDEGGARLRHTVYWHNGSNTMWYALVAFVPEKKMVVAVTSNDGDINSAEEAAWDIVNACGHQIDVAH